MIGSDRNIGIEARVSGKMSETMFTTGDARERGPCSRCGRLGHEDARSRRCLARAASIPEPSLFSAAAYDVSPGVVQFAPDDTAVREAPADPTALPSGGAAGRNPPAGVDVVERAVAESGGSGVAPLSITSLVPPPVDPAARAVRAKPTSIIAREIRRISREVSDRRAELEILEARLARAVDDYDDALADEMADDIAARIMKIPGSLPREFPLLGAPDRVVTMVVHDLISRGWLASVGRNGLLRVGSVGVWIVSDTGGRP